MCAKLLQSCLTLCDLWTHQVPLSMGISRQEYWSGLLCPPPGDLPNPGTEPTSLMSPALAGGFFTTGANWEAQGGYSLMTENSCWKGDWLGWYTVGKEIQPVHSEGDQPWDFFGRNDAKAETPVLWPPQEKSWLIGKDSDAGRDWGQEEKGMTEDEMAGWHHWLNGCESEWILGVGDGQGGLACCDSWGRKESDTTERLNWTELNWIELVFYLIWGQGSGQFRSGGSLQ